MINRRAIKLLALLVAVASSAHVTHEWEISTPAMAPVECFARLNASAAVAVANCVYHFANTHTLEDVELLPMLLRSTNGAFGSFFEIGAATGMDGSQTLVLEKCFGWRGILVEAQPLTFEKLRDSPRLGTKVWAAACKTGGSVNFTAFSNQAQARIVEGDVRPSRKMMRAYGKSALTPVTVPCRAMRDIMDDAGYHGTMDFLSLDVQGAELIALRTVYREGVPPVVPFSVVLFEAEGRDEASHAKSNTVSQMLVDSGLRRRPLHLPSIDAKAPYGSSGYNKLYARAELADGRPSVANLRSNPWEVKSAAAARERGRPRKRRIADALISLGFPEHAVRDSREFSHPCTRSAVSCDTESLFHGKCSGER